MAFDVIFPISFDLQPQNNPIVLSMLETIDKSPDLHRITAIVMYFYAELAEGARAVPTRIVNCLER